MLLKLLGAVWNWWFRLPDKLRFLLVGGFNATVSYILYVLMILWWGAQYYQMALMWSWIISSFSSFTTQKIFVFCTRGKWSKWIKEYIKCLGVWVTSYIINAVILELLVNGIKMNPYIGQIIATACTTITGYILMKYFAFNNKKSPLK